YHSLWPNRLDTNLARSVDGGESWTVRLADHAPSMYIGIGAALSVTNATTAYLSYEVFSGATSNVRVARTTDGGTPFSLFEVEQGTVGENPAIKAFDSGVVHIAYHDFGMHTVTVASSSDAAVSWTIMPIPEPGRPTLYLDLDAPTETVAYVSYLA